MQKFTVLSSIINPFSGFFISKMSGFFKAKWFFVVAVLSIQKFPCIVIVV